MMTVRGKPEHQGHGLDELLVEGRCAICTSAGCG